jgi:hypothetical protein
MRELLDLGVTTPPMENCAQVGSREYDYLDRARKEAKALISMIRRTVGPEPDGASLGTKMHDHDFGPYLTVVCRYDADDKVAADYAFACDSQLPPEWDEAARRELGLVM